MTTTVLNLKISQVENKIPNASGLVKKKKKKKKKILMINYQTLKEIFTTSDYNNFTSDIRDAR